MSSQEFILIAEKTMETETYGSHEKSTVSQVAENHLDIVEKRVLKSLSMMKPGHLGKTKPILEKITKSRM